MQTFNGGFNRSLQHLYREERTAFTITARIYRGGGFIKDAVYFRGLLFVMDYLSRLNARKAPGWPAGNIARRPFEGHVSIVP